MRERVVVDFRGKKVSYYFNGKEKEVEMTIKRIEMPEFKQVRIEVCSEDLTMQDIEKLKEAYKPLEISIERQENKTCAVLKVMEQRP